MSAPVPGPRPEDLARVAQAALAHVRDDMLLGLGTGRAAEAFIHALGDRVRQGLRVRAVPTSNRSADLAGKLGIPVLGLADVDHLDIAFDGADEVALDLSPSPRASAAPSCASGWSPTRPRASSSS